MKLILLFCLMFGSFAHASREAGNGGDGLIIDGKVYVLDLVEAGAEKNPYFAPNVTANPALVALVRKNLPRFPEVVDRLAHKLTEIEKVSPITAWSIGAGLGLYTFRVVAEELVNVPDEDSVVDFPIGTLVQLAIRKQKTIFLNGKQWPTLDVDQKVALLIHEMVYAFQNGYETGIPQGSVGARAIVGYLFTEDIRDTGRDGLLRVLHGESRLYQAADEIRSKITGIEKDTDIPDALNFVSPTKTFSRKGSGTRYLRDVNKNSSGEEIARACKEFDKFDHQDIYFTVPQTLNLLGPSEGIELSVLEEDFVDNGDVWDQRLRRINCPKRLKEVLTRAY